VTSTTSRLKVATWNIGNGTLANARKIMSEGVAALALQEASDQRDLVEALVDDGFEVIRPEEQTGQPATPLVYDPAVLQLRRSIAVLTADSQPVGPGTGPDKMKAKWLIGARFVHLPSRRRIAIASHHRVAGQQHETRHRVALEDARRVAETFVGYRSLVTVMGDWNSTAGDHTLKPLRHHGWTCNQLVGGHVGTHGQWAPDHVWWKKDDRISYVQHRVLTDTESDHRPLLVTFELTSRPS